MAKIQHWLLNLGEVSEWKLLGGVKNKRIYDL
jgi:hypothetical protein